MSYEVKQGNIFGRIGSSLGKGLAEQIPKEVERNRLSQGLQKFEQESSGLTPLQQYTRLAAIPGITPEHLYTIVPLLRQQMQREEGGKSLSGTKGETSSGQAISTPEIKPKKFIEPTKEAGKKATLKTLESTKAQLTPIIIRSDQELMPEAAELSRQNPTTYPTPLDALPTVKQNEQTRVTNLNEQRNVGNSADTLKQRLQKGLKDYSAQEDTLKNIPGTVQNKILQNIEDELANPNNKLSEGQLIKKHGEVLKNIALQDTNLDERSRQWLGPEYTPKKIINAIETTRKPWKEADSTEEYKDRLSSKFNFTDPVASYFSDPPENRQANKIINNLPKPKVNNYGIANPSDIRKISIEAADKITPYIRDEDSLSSYAMAVKKRGGDAKVFFDRIQQNAKAGMFKPTSRHDREFTKGIPAIPSIGDFYIFGLTDQEDLLE